MKARRPTGRVGRRFLIVLEIAFLIAVIYSIYWWKTSDLLMTDGSIQAPYFQLQDLQGNIRTPEDFKGKPTVLYFFAPWCKVCNASAHQLRWFDRWSADKVNLVMVGMDWEDAEELAEFARTHELTNVILIGDSSTARNYQLKAYPTYYVLDSMGITRSRDIGYTTVLGLVARTSVSPN